MRSVCPSVLTGATGIPAAVSVRSPLSSVWSSVRASSASCSSSRWRRRSAAEAKRGSAASPGSSSASHRRANRLWFPAATISHPSWTRNASYGAVLEKREPLGSGETPVPSAARICAFMSM